MAKVNVTAYFMHESEESAAKTLMPGALETEGFLIGEVDESALPALEAAGLIVQKNAPASPPKPESGPTAPVVRPASATRGIDLASPADVVPALIDFYKVRLKGPVVELWRNQLAAAGCVLIEADESGAYKARLNLGQIDGVKALPFVESVTWIEPPPSTASVRTESAGPRRGFRRVAVKEPFDVRLHLADGLGTVMQWLNNNGITVVGASGRKIRISIDPEDSRLDDLGSLPEVDKVNPYVPPELFNDVARGILGIDAPVGHNPATFIKQDGAGQIIAVADTGIDDQHPDFQGRIMTKVALGRPGDTSDPNGHGTHVTGSILGDGSACHNQIRGIAPKAQLYFQSLLDANDGLGGLPLDLKDLFQAAYDADPRIRIHSNSWGSVTPSTYTFSSEEVDDFIWNHRDMLVVIAAGNAGKAARPLKSAPGFVDWLSIGSPASCKNALTVGACRSSRTDGPMGNQTWSAVFGTSFPDPPIANELISGNPEAMAAFSSRGPCDDFRIKPDVVAPGTDILSTKSSLAPIENFAGPFAGNAAYAFDQGTSMATPLVAGCAVLVRQYYTELAHEPSAALIKATLVNSSQWLSAADSTATPGGTPNYHQGFGRVSMDKAIPNDSDPDFRLQFIDDWKNPGAAMTRTGQRMRFHVVLPAAVPELRFCLAYTDAPGRAIQNNLNLMVQHVESSTKCVGNPSRPDQLTLLDTTNNVEIVRIPNAAAGNYFIVVVASNLLKTPQDFALVATAKGLPPLNPA